MQLFPEKAAGYPDAKGPALVSDKKFINFLGHTESSETTQSSKVKKENLKDVV
jgi:hypothetical protein